MMEYFGNNHDERTSILQNNVKLLLLNDHHDLSVFLLFTLSALIAAAVLSLLLFFKYVLGKK